jgi:hypothetical protein
VRLDGRRTPKVRRKDRAIMAFMRWTSGAALAATQLCSGEAEAKSCAVTVEVRDARPTARALGPRNGAVDDP